MEILHSKSNSFNPSLLTKKYKIIDVALVIYLGIGAISFLASILYLYFNIDQVDKIIYYCLTGFFIFISGTILNAIGSENILGKQKSMKDD